MGQFTNKASVFFRAYGDNAAVDDDEFMRKGEFDAGLSGRARIIHTHSYSQITDFADGVLASLGVILEDSESVHWNEGTNFSADVRLKAGGYISVDADGLFVLSGTGSGLAPDNHTHAQLHDPVTFQPSNTIQTTLGGTGQQITNEVILADGGGLMDYGSGSGIGCDFGTGANQVVRWSDVEGALHSPVTLQDSVNVHLEFLGDQKIMASVLTKNDLLPGQGGIFAYDSNGLWVVLGSGLNEAAPGNHTHPLADEFSPGLLSPEGFRAITNSGSLFNIDQNVLFSRPDVLMTNEFVGGRYRWGQAMEVRFMDLTASGGLGTATLELEIDGSGLEYITIPSSVGGDEVVNYKDFSVILPADHYLRIKGYSGLSANAEENPSRINVTVGVRPLATLDTIRLNAGGGSVPSAGWSADGYYSGGPGLNYFATSVTCDTSGVSDPAPQEVYKVIRTTYATGSTIQYDVIGLASGVTYRVRMHFNAALITVPGYEIMNIQVSGDTVQQIPGYDVAASVGANKADMKSLLIKPDSTGKIQVLLTATGTFGCSIAGLEFIPQL